MVRGGARARVRGLAAELSAAGARLAVHMPDGETLRMGPGPARATVHLRDASALAAVACRDHLALAEAYLAGRIDVDGDLLEVMKVTEVVPPGASAWERLRPALRLALRPRRAVQREAVAFHYDRPPEFFLPWFERWRSYSHGLYETPDDPPEAAQARKLQRAMDALGLKPGMRVFDMGCGWGSFLEYAGRQGVEVHGITLSREQHRFVSELVRRQRLPCRVEHVDFLDFRPRERFHGAVFMGTFEHFPHYRRAARFLARWLEPEARVWADFCTAPGGHHVGAFLDRYVWPGAARYVDVPALIRALERAGLHVYELRDDTESYACTVRDWADAFERAQPGLEARFGREATRAFQLFLRASQHFLSTGRTRACHLVAGRGAAPLPGRVARA